MVTIEPIIRYPNSEKDAVIKTVYEWNPEIELKWFLTIRRRKNVRQWLSAPIKPLTISKTPTKTKNKITASTKSLDLKHLARKPSPGWSPPKRRFINFNLLFKIKNENQRLLQISSARTVQLESQIFVCHGYGWGCAQRDRRLIR